MVAEGFCRMSPAFDIFLKPYSGGHYALLAHKELSFQYCG